MIFCWQMFRSLSSRRRPKTSFSSLSDELIEKLLVFIGFLETIRFSFCSKRYHAIIKKKLSSIPDRTEEMIHIYLGVYTCRGILSFGVTGNPPVVMGLQNTSQLTPAFIPLDPRRLTDAMMYYFITRSIYYSQWVAKHFFLLERSFNLIDIGRLINRFPHSGRKRMIYPFLTSVLLDKNFCYQEFKPMFMKCCRSYLLPVLFMRLFVEKDEQGINWLLPPSQKTLAKIACYLEAFFETIKVIMAKYNYDTNSLVLEDVLGVIAKKIQVEKIPWSGIEKPRILVEKDYHSYLFERLIGQVECFRLSSVIHSIIHDGCNCIVNDFISRVKFVSHHKVVISPIFLKAIIKCYKS